MNHDFFFDRERETLPPAEIKAIHRSRITAMFSVVFNHNAFYQRKFRAAGWQEVPKFDDWQQFPFTTKSELIADASEYPPYGSNLTYPLEHYVRLHQTSGTTGKPLIVLDTAESWKAWKRSWGYIFRAAGLVPGDRVYVAFSFGLFIGFWPPIEAGPELGYLVLPGGGQTSSQRLRAILEHQATVLLCTPSYALHLAEVARDQGIRLSASSIRITIHAGEPGASIPATKRRIEEVWGAKCFDHIGASEIGPFGFECHLQPGGVHVNELDYICEVIDPTSLKPVGPGEMGELVLTNLDRWSFPVIRYRTGDLVRFSEAKPCVCGRTFRMLMGGILARADDMMIIRGVNVYPSAIEAVVREFKEVAEFEGQVFTRKGMDEMLLKLELKDEPALEPQKLQQKIQQELRNRLGLRIETELAPPGSLPRYEMKARRFKRVAVS
ncbi:MAG: phenylacetate--CoA ligase family protein [Candidatus Binatia bacterium]